METIWRDLKFAANICRKSPGFTAVAVISLAIGIGANTAIFSVTDALLFRPLPYENAERLAILWSRSPGLNVPQDWFSPGQYLDIKTQNETFEETAIAIGGSFNLTGLGKPQHVDGARVSSSLFTLLGAKPLLGREIQADEDVPGRPAVVVLSYGFWHRELGADSNAVGRVLTLNGNDFSIVGVMRPGFTLNKEVMPAVNGIQNADLLVPLPMNEAARNNRGNEDFNIFARLKPGISVAQAQADMDVIADRMKSQYPGNYPPSGGLTISVVPLLDQVVGDIHTAVFVLFGAVAAVLLVACANVASLMLSRANARQKEIAVRLAIGAGRARVIRQLLTESALIGAMGGVLGLGVAVVTIRTLRFIGSENIPRLSEVGLDGRVFLFTGVVALLTGFVFGLVPAFRASRIDISSALKESGRSGEGIYGRSQNRSRKLLVVFEVAVSLILLVGAGLLVRSYQRAVSANPGFNPHNVLSMRLQLPPGRYTSQDSIVTFYRKVTEQLRGVPNVESVATTYSLPMSTVALAWEPIRIEGYVPKNEKDIIISNVRIVSPEYFRTLGVACIQGRFFDEHDTKGQMQTVIVNEALADRFWPGQDPIGKRLQRGTANDWRTVVGVIRDSKEYSTEKEPPIAVYFPFEQYVARNMFLVVRTASEPTSMLQAVTDQIQSVDGDLPVFDVATMEQRLSDSLARRRFAMFLLSGFAAVALVLGAVGIFGVISYSVNQRTHELGIRMALGAQPRGIKGLVLREAMTLAVSGVVIGLAGAFFLTRLMSSLLYGVSTTDPITMIIAPIVLGGAAVFASYVPARRAARVDPMIALRHE